MLAAKHIAPTYVSELITTRRLVREARMILIDAIAKASGRDLDHQVSIFAEAVDDAASILAINTTKEAE